MVLLLHSHVIGVQCWFQNLRSMRISSGENIERRHERTARPVPALARRLKITKVPHHPFRGRECREAQASAGLDHGPQFSGTAA